MGRKKIARPEAERIKSILITKTAIKELVSEDTIEKVIMFQFKDFRDMVFEHDQIEITGFGKFLVSGNKLKNKIRKLENAIRKYTKKLEETPDTSGKNIEFWKETITSCTTALEDLKTRRSGYENKH